MHTVLIGEILSFVFVCRYIATFKQELSTSVASLSVGSGKGGEDEALKALYRKYVRNEHNTSTGRKPVRAQKHAIPHFDKLA
jgi:hypothetical protein